MTAIVGFVKNGNVYMAGDTLGSNGFTKSEYTESKVFINGDFILGYTSSFRFGEILEYNFKPPKQENGVSDKRYLVTSFIPELRKCLEENKYTAKDQAGTSGTALLGYKGKLYKLQDDFSILEASVGYDSCGSGEYHCEAVLWSLCDSKLHPKKIVRKAIQCASEKVTSVGGTITVKVLKSNKGGKD